jgi:hypothetical protein
MEAEALVTELARLDVALSVNAGKLVCSAPKDALSDDLRRRITELKPQLLTLLEARRTADEVVPLSLSQARIHAIATLLPAASAASNVPLAFRLTGSLDLGALERALQAVVQRHEVFRSRCSPGPVMVIQHEASVALPLHDLRARPEASRAAELRRLIDALVASPMRLDVAPIFRAALLRLRDDEWVLVLVTHVFVFDGRSTPVLLTDLGERYGDALAGRDPGAAPPAPRYSDFVRWQRRELGEELLARQRAWWRATLTGTSTITALGAGADREYARYERDCGHVPVLLPDFLTRAVKELARQSGATLFHTLLAAYALLLQRHTLRESLAIGTIVSDRRGLAAERTIGSFANNILLRADFGQRMSFRGLLVAVRDRARAALAHLDLPFESVLAELDPDLRRDPPFRVMFVLHQSSGTDDGELRLPGLQVARLPVDEQRGHYLLDLVLSDTDAGIAGSLIHAVPALSRATAEALVQRYIGLLSLVCADPDAELASLPAHPVEPAPCSSAHPLAPAMLASPPLDARESAIARIWATLLELDQVGRDQDFFDLGGHSLLALAMLRTVAAELGPLEQGGLAQFAERPTVATLARLCPRMSEAR